MGQIEKKTNGKSSICSAVRRNKNTWPTGPIGLAKMLPAISLVNLIRANGQGIFETRNLRAGNNQSWQKGSDRALRSLAVCGRLYPTRVRAQIRVIK
jgi:hypothetical protein